MRRLENEDEDGISYLPDGIDVGRGVVETDGHKALVSVEEEAGHHESEPVLSFRKRIAETQLGMGKRRVERTQRTKRMMPAKSSL